MIYYKILSLCMERFNLTEEQLLGPSRKVPIMDGKHVFIALCYAYWIRSTKQLGRHFGRVHSVILHSIKAAQRPYLRDIYEELETRLNAKPLPAPFYKNAA